MTVNNQPKKQGIVISLTSSDDEKEPNGHRRKKRKCNEEDEDEEGFVEIEACRSGGGGGEVVIDLCYSSSDELRVLLDLSRFRNLAEMISAEAVMRKNKKKKRRRRRRKKKKREIELEAQEETVDAGKEEEQGDTVKDREITKVLETDSVLISENEVPQKLLVDAEKEEEQADTCKAVETTKACETGDGVRFAEVIDLCLSSSEEDEDEVIADLSNSRGSGGMLLTEVDTVKEGEQPDTVKGVETTKALETELVPITETIVKGVETTKALEAELVTITETIMPLQLSVDIVQEEKQAKQADTGKDVETMISLETESVEIKDNTVLRKLLRGPRYFDPLESSWGICYNCGEEGHTAFNCKAQKRKKPCFVCGDLEHSAKHCKKGHNCFVCKVRGHLAKDCPERHKGNYLSSKICLRCGDLGHDMFSCSNDYSPDDLKEMQCYVCKDFGHLCCAGFVDLGPREVSCYHCGQSGHLGSGCTKLRRDINGSQSPSSCYKCGEEGHFARRCTKFAKAGQKMGDLSTPTQRHPKEKKDILGSESAPHDLYKAHNKKKTEYEERVIMTGGQSRWRGGWNTNKPQNLFYREARANVWLSPAASAQNSYEISALTACSNFSSPQYPQVKLNHHPGTPSSQVFQPGFSASRFGNSSNHGVQIFQW